MKLDLTQKTKLEPMTNAQIILGANLPKNYEENLARQKDPTFQKLLDEWDDETDPTLKELKNKAIDEYWAERRKELGFNEPEILD